MSSHARIRRLEAIGRDRALTPLETAQLQSALYHEMRRQVALPARIMRLRATLRQLEAELWREHLPVLRELEAAAEDARRNTIEHELAQPALQQEQFA